MLSRVHLRSKCSYGWRIYYRFHGNEYFRGTTTRDKKGWKLIDRIRRSKDRVHFLFRRFRNMGIAREVCNVAVTRSASASSGGGGRGNTMARLRVLRVVARISNVFPKRSVERVYAQLTEVKFYHGTYRMYSVRRVNKIHSFQNPYRGLHQRGSE